MQNLWQCKCLGKGHIYYTHREIFEVKRKSLQYTMTTSKYLSIITKKIYK